MAIEISSPVGRRETHEVVNQVPPLEDWNPFLTDVALQQALEREGAGWSKDQVTRHSKRAGSAEVVSWGYLANENLPRLRTHDRFGQRIDEVVFHPAWHSLMSWSMENEVHSLPWTRPGPGAWVARSALFMLSAMADAGHCCPISMATACVPTLRKAPELAAEWVPRVSSTKYDSRFIVPREKTACLIGMAMTEKQGGSDVRANRTRAVPLGEPGVAKPYLITGHKWFCSAPMCDAFLILAQAPNGLSCLLLPRVLEDGKHNGFYIQRLKDKLGNRSNASSEVEFDNAVAWLVGEEGRGVPTIIEMVNNTRLDCSLISAGMMRLAVAQAVHHTRHRSAFGKKLLDHVQMQNVVADLALESEAATVLLMRLARSYDLQNESEREGQFRRLVTAAAKYWICRRAPALICEAMECMGGNGFTEEVIFPRLYREAPLNSMWEGSGNVICLDVQRALRNTPETLSSLLDELRLAAGADARLDAAVRSLETQLRESAHEPGDGRRLAERIAVVLEASLLVRHAPSFVADAFIASRVLGENGICFGTLPRSVNYGLIVERAFADAGKPVARSIGNEREVLHERADGYHSTSTFRT
ncbi:MAG TPA: acyl-CoA dehydrogenase family protein [Candidatus Acidoferrum sp.]|nr:acyl-CoA dehydrogenase family protein [Candidatus Acidoferrum sp.]